MTEESKAFFSYSRLDAEFALKLAKDLRNAGASVWIDQLDISPGTIGISQSKKLLVRRPVYWWCFRRIPSNPKT